MSQAETLQKQPGQGVEVSYVGVVSGFVPLYLDVFGASWLQRCKYLIDVDGLTHNA